MGHLPEVPTLDTAPRPDAAAIVAEARAQGDTEPAPPGAKLRAPLPRKTSKLSGAQRRKIERAKERGEPVPKFEPRLVPPREPDPPPAAPAAAAPPPADDAPPPPAPEPRLTPEDVDAAAAARAAEQRAIALAPRISREELEERVGRLAQFVFTGVGFALGDRELEVWPLSESQEGHMGELLVEAWPDECAKMMTGPNNMVRLLAVGTIARLAWERFLETRRRKLSPSSAPRRSAQGDTGRQHDEHPGRQSWDDGATIAA